MAESAEPSNRRRERIPSRLGRIAGLVGVLGMLAMLSASEDTLFESRAYVVVSNADLRIDDVTLKGDLTVANRGNEPAEDVTVFWAAFALSDPAKPLLLKMLARIGHLDAKGVRHIEDLRSFAHFTHRPFLAGLMVVHTDTCGSLRWSAACKAVSLWPVSTPCDVRTILQAMKRKMAEVDTPASPPLLSPSPSLGGQAQYGGQLPVWKERKPGFFY